MATAPHLVQALQDARALAGEHDEAVFEAVAAQASRVLERLDADVADPTYTDDVEAAGPVGEDLDPDTVDRAVASLTALQEQPDEVQAEIALAALTDLEDVLVNAPGPGSHPGA